MKKYVILLIALISLFSFVSADAIITSTPSSFSGYGGVYSSSNYQYQPSFQTYYGRNVDNYWPIIDNADVCRARQDIILQVAPAGCQPMVVRSDLLADQNVPVFCQIDALQINPIIDIKEISNIRFTGKYPNEVVGVGFHPAKAALNTRDRLIGNPTIGNIGYVVVILKQTKNESSLPNFVNLTLSGKIDYSAGNSLGVGTAEFYLTPLNNQEWNSEKVKNSFWKGRYYIRLDSADERNAIVSLYYGDQKISSTSVDLGKTSDRIYLPGGYCQFGLQVQYAALMQAETKARIEVSSDKGIDSFDVYRNSEFLNGRCRVSELNYEGIGAGSVKIICGSQVLNLYLTPSLNIQNLPYGTLKVTEITEENNRLQECRVDFTDGKIYRITRKVIASSKQTTYDSWSVLQAYNKDVNSWANVVNENDLLVAEKIRTALASSCELKDDVFLSKDPNVASIAEKAFNDAIISYTQVADDYPAEEQTKSQGVAKYGELALQGALNLVEKANEKNYGKSQTKAEILDKYVNLYPESATSYSNQKQNLFNIDSSSAIKSINIDNKFQTIRLVSLEEPNKNEKAKAFFNYGNIAFNMIKGEQKYLPSKSALINLTDFDAFRATLKTNCFKVERNGVVSYQIKDNEYNSVTIQFGKSEDVCGEPLLFKETDLQKVARIRILPTAYGPQTETNITVTIGIEKRNIQLSPEKAKSMIANLNKSIAQWESISKNLVKLETGLKSACFATAGVLTVKSFLSGTDGSALAREKLMTGEYGWNKRCNDAITSHNLDVNGDGKFDSNDKLGVTYGTVSQCINENSAEIEKQVNDAKQALTTTNNVVKEVQSQTGVTVNGVVNQDKAIEGMLAKVRADCKSVALPDPVKKTDGTYLYPYTLTELRDIYYNCKLLQQGQDKSALEAINAINSSAFKLAGDYTSYINNQGSKEFIPIDSTREGVTRSGRFYPIASDGTKVGDIVITNGDAIKDKGTSAVIYSSGELVCQGIQGQSQAIGGPYLIVGTEKNGKLQQSGIFPFSYNRASGVVQSITITNTAPECTNQGAVNNFMSKNNLVSFEEYGQGLYGNTMRVEDRKVLYFASGVDKDMPSQVPFDVKNGWYAKVEPVSYSLGSTKVSNYDASGLPKSWQICNVGDDTIINGKDKCQRVDQGISTSYQILGLDQKTSQTLVQQSQRALLQAASQKGAKGKVNILGQDMGVDYSNPLESLQCTNFMSSSDCQILFNVCDPVICPASRCNLGGAYRVANVQQTGIVGSALLCLPNAREGIYLPVCVSGIRNGIDSYVSLLKQHRDCLQQNINSGELVGICDELQSIYSCEFFWKQMAPVANLLLPKLIENAYGNKASTGGGEYLLVSSAWQNAQSGMDYFTQYYAENTFKAFQARSIEEAGTDICKGFISAKAPTALKTLLEPDSPPQFYARFDSSTFSTVTVPATAQYKAFYFINAGNDAGVYYSVYLKNPPTSGYYYSTQTIPITSGFLAKGQSASETKDFTAPEGYKELCVNINSEETCGFQQVSTDFALNYLRDNYAKEQLTETNIQSASQCVSGTASISAIGANLNPQAALSEATNPQISQRGIIRICASDNPGQSTDPTRFIRVGNCGSPDMGCWLDKNSVSNAITDSNVGVKNATLEELSQVDFNNLVASGEIVNEEVAVTTIRAISSKKDALRINLDNGRNILEDAKTLEGEISAIYNKLVLNNHKAWLLLVRAEVKAMEAEYYMKGIDLNQVKLPSSTSTSTPTTTHSGTPTSADNTGANNAGVSTSLALDKTYNAQGTYKLLDSSSGQDSGIYILNGQMKLNILQYNARRNSDITLNGIDQIIGNVDDNFKIILNTNAKTLLTDSDYSLLSGASANNLMVWPASSQLLPTNVNSNTLAGQIIPSGAHTYKITESATKWYNPTTWNDRDLTSCFVKYGTHPESSPISDYEHYSIKKTYQTFGAEWFLYYDNKIVKSLDSQKQKIFDELKTRCDIPSIVNLRNEAGVLTDYTGSSKTPIILYYNGDKSNLVIYGNKVYVFALVQDRVSFSASKLTLGTIINSNGVYSIKVENKQGWPFANFEEPIYYSTLVNFLDNSKIDQEAIVSF